MNTHPLLYAYKPTDSDPFDQVKAAHLLSRAGFGGTPEEIDKVLKLGPQKAVDWLMDFPDAPAESNGDNSGPDLSSLADQPSSFAQYRTMLQDASPDQRKMLQQKFQQSNREAIGAITKWWLNRMAYGDYPLQEKLTFFWHGHFTTSARDERAASLMWRQNELLRRYAAGNFQPFLHAISKDPAMLDYLNNSQNKKQHPNENYAREVMELFTLGIGNYTEDDVKEAARAFTGWTHDGDEFVFREFQHDYGQKTFLGQTGNFDGDNVLDIILQQQECPKFVAEELFQYLAYDATGDSLADALGDVFLSNNYELRPLIQTILTSRAFYSPQCIGVQIKSPVQLMVGTVRLLGLRVPPELATISALNQMGQVPLMPPNVRGWPGGHLWINTSTLFIRYNTGVWLAGGDVPSLTRINPKATDRELPPGIARPNDFEPQASGSADDVVSYWLARLIQRPIEDDKKQVLVGALGDDPTDTDAQRRVVQLIVSMPEYQLC
jgi:uncharacterized protein DUF1800